MLCSKMSNYISGPTAFTINKYIIIVIVVIGTILFELLLNAN
jgi:hypothetical protein